MKKAKKLMLCRETLRSLESPAVARVWGGAPRATRFPCVPVQTGGSCDCTLSCPELCVYSGEDTCLCV